MPTLKCRPRSCHVSACDVRAECGPPALQGLAFLFIPAPTASPTSHHGLHQGRLLLRLLPVLCVPPRRHRHGLGGHGGAQRRPRARLLVPVCYTSTQQMQGGAAGTGTSNYEIFSMRPIPSPGQPLLHRLRLPRANDGHRPADENHDGGERWLPRWSSLRPDHPASRGLVRLHQRHHRRLRRRDDLTEHHLHLAQTTCIHGRSICRLPAPRAAAWSFSRRPRPLAGASEHRPRGGRARRPGRRRAAFARRLLGVQRQLLLVEWREHRRALRLLQSISLRQRDTHGAPDRRRPCATGARTAGQRATVSAAGPTTTRTALTDMATPRGRTRRATCSSWCTRTATDATQ